MVQDIGKEINLPAGVPLVSVVLPTYNRAMLVGRAITSVLSQTVADLELIVVDDGSTDQTSEFLSKLTDPRVRPVFLKTNQGVAGARNAGIQAAVGRYLAFQDSDDIWLADKLERQISAFSKAGPAVGVCYCGFLRREPGRQIYIPGSRSSRYEGLIYSRLLRSNFVTPQTALIKREYLDKLEVVFDAKLPPLEDWDLFLRLARTGCQFLLVNQPLVKSQLMEDSISADPQTLLQSHRRLIEKQLPHLNGRPILRGRLMRSLGASHYVLGLNMAAQKQMQDSRHQFRQAWQRSPLNLKYLSSWVLSLINPAWWLQVMALFRRWPAPLLKKK